MATSKAILALYSFALVPFEFQLVAVTNPIQFDAAQTYDNIPFTTSPIVNPGAHRMMALYESDATPRREGNQ
jgi:hypothetical protein